MTTEYKDIKVIAAEVRHKLAKEFPTCKLANCKIKGALMREVERQTTQHKGC